MSHLSPYIIAPDHKNRRIPLPSSDRWHAEHLQNVIEGHQIQNMNSNLEANNILLCRAGENARISDRKKKPGKVKFHPNFPKSLGYQKTREEL